MGTRAPSGASRLAVGVLVALAALALVVLVLGRSGSGSGSTASPVGGNPSASPSLSSSPSRAASPAVNAGRATPRSDLPTVAAADLPREARTVLKLIHAGGPFPYRQDGATFGNRERLLPARPSGYYREYTVRTPGESDRGARRIIGGRDGDLFYTDDHYDSFRQIEEVP